MIRKEEYSNGLVLLTETMPDVRSVSLGVWLRQGSRQEKPALNGVSHFIEHLVFKGTETRSAKEIALAMESVGGQMDAFTAKEYTCFYAKVLDQHLEDAVDLLSDIVQHPKFDPDEIERERKVVLEEIRMVEDTPDDLIYDLFSTHFFPRSSLGRPIQGTVETVGSFSRRRLLRFFRKAYRPENMLIVAAGNLNHRQLSRMVRERFGSMKSGSVGAAETVARPRVRGGVTTRSKRLEQMHLLLGLPAFPEQLNQRFPLFVLNALLGGTMSSRLFQKVREERGLAYNVYSGVNAFIDSGFLMVYAATSAGKGSETVRLVMRELQDLRENGPSVEEVAVAKEHLKGSLMLSLESTSSRMSNLARQELYFGKQFTLKQILNGIDRVTARSVHTVASEVLKYDKVGLAALGKVSRLRLADGILSVE